MKSQFLAAVFSMAVALSSASVFGQSQGGGNDDSGNTGGGGGATSTSEGATSANTRGFTQLENTGVGASAATVREQNAATGLTTATGAAGGGGGFGGGGGLGGLGLGGLGFGGLGQGFGGSSASSEPAVRTRLRSAVSVQPLQPREIQSAAQARFYQAPVAPKFGGVQVNMLGGNAVITGSVRSDKDRRMSELLMRLEPGVRNVTNRVTVSP